MKGFRVYCRRCHKIDADCLMCLATSTTCVMFAREGENGWITPRPEGQKKSGDLYFGDRYWKGMVTDASQLTQEEREEIEINLMMRELNGVRG